MTEKDQAVISQAEKVEFDQKKKQTNKQNKKPSNSCVYENSTPRNVCGANVHINKERRTKNKQTNKQKQTSKQKHKQKQKQTTNKKRNKKQKQKQKTKQTKQNKKP